MENIHEYRNEQGDDPEVYVRDGRLHVSSQTADREMVRFYEEVQAAGGDPREEFWIDHRIGVIGRRAMGSDMETQHLEKVAERFFGEMTQSNSELLDRRLQVVDERFEKRLREQQKADEERVRQTEKLLGDVKETGEELRSAITEALESSAKDTRTGVKDTVREQLDGHTAQSRKLLNPEDSDSPLHRLGKDVDKLTEQVRKVETALEVTEATRGERSKGHGKGWDYQDVVHDAASDLAKVRRDVPEFTANQKGMEGSQGDTVITLCEQDASNVELKVAVEARNKAQGLRAILRDLDSAKRSRGAETAIGVFASEDQMPRGHAPFSDCGQGRFLVCFDADEEDPRWLEQAYHMARYEALAALRGRVEVDAGRLGELLEEAKRRLETLSQLKRDITTGKKTVENHYQGLWETVDGMQDEVSQLFSEMEKAIQPAEPERAGSNDEEPTSF